MYYTQIYIQNSIYVTFKDSQHDDFDLYQLVMPEGCAKCNYGISRRFFLFPFCNWGVSDLGQEKFFARTASKHRRLLGRSLPPLVRAHHSERLGPDPAHGCDLVPVKGRVLLGRESTRALLHMISFVQSIKNSIKFTYLLLFPLLTKSGMSFLIIEC